MLSQALHDLEILEAVEQEKQREDSLKASEEMQDESRPMICAEPCEQEAESFAHEKDQITEREGNDSAKIDERDASVEACQL